MVEIRASVESMCNQTRRLMSASLRGRRVYLVSDVVYVALCVRALNPYSSYHCCVFLLQFSLKISEKSSLKQIVSLDAGAPYVKFHTKVSYSVHYFPKQNL